MHGLKNLTRPADSTGQTRNQNLVWSEIIIEAAMTRIGQRLFESVKNQQNRLKLVRLRVDRFSVNNKETVMKWKNENINLYPEKKKEKIDCIK